MTALEDVSLEIGEGELLAIVGENGAGKSTLMNVLYGLYRPDAGEIRFGEEAVKLRSPREAIARGIGMVHQHFMLVPTLTVAENVVLGHEPTRRGLFDFDRACEQVSETCQRFGFTLDPRARIDRLSVGSQQKVEIVKALHRGAKTLILDEPTAVLTPQEAEELFRVARALAKEQHTVVFISHKLREVLSVATRIAVMRRGKKVAEVRPEETTPDALASLMVGQTVSTQVDRTRRRTPAPIEPRKVLEFRKLTAAPKLHDVTLHVNAGEIVGIAGVDGNGQRELAEVATGLLPYDSGELVVRGEALRAPSPADLRRRGLAHIPEDRLARAIVGPLRVEENVSLGRHQGPPFARGKWIDAKSRRERTQALLEGNDVRPPDPLIAIAALSGGNQQKVVVARELDSRPQLLVAVQPTRGLDVGAVSAVHNRLDAERNRGTGVLLVSLDLDEVLALADRIYVLFQGRVMGERLRGQFDVQELGRMMLGTANG